MVFMWICAGVIVVRKIVALKQQKGYKGKFERRNNVNGYENDA